LALPPALGDLKNKDGFISRLFKSPACGGKPNTQMIFIGCVSTRPLFGGQAISLKTALMAALHSLILCPLALPSVFGNLKKD